MHSAVLHLILVAFLESVSFQLVFRNIRNLSSPLILIFISICFYVHLWNSGHFFGRDMARNPYPIRNYTYFNEFSAPCF